MIVAPDPTRFGTEMANDMLNEALVNHLRPVRWIVTGAVYPGEFAWCSGRATVFGLPVAYEDAAFPYLKENGFFIQLVTEPWSAKAEREHLARQMIATWMELEPSCRGPF